ncbi:hypothetical protein JB92DRAFT_2942414 [Gautieria morchelliformis]|nr:hypothetical protein JB92DRAFT_2942414 [Gautieria morchelliformis]
MAGIENDGVEEKQKSKEGISYRCCKCKCDVMLGTDGWAGCGQTEQHTACRASLFKPAPPS